MYLYILQFKSNENRILEDVRVGNALYWNLALLFSYNKQSSNSNPAIEAYRKKLIIREKKNCFHIVSHEDASPLILGKKIIN